MEAHRLHECDVLVVGSGAGGLATAVTAAHNGQSVLVVEKEPVFGGTTARSGGWMWIPGSGPAKRAGVDDNADKATTYLQHETGNHFDAARVDAFLRAGPEAVEFFEENTELQFELGPAFADYHTNAPGAVAGGRSILARPFDGRMLKDEIRRLRPPLQEITFLGMMIGSGKELVHFFNVLRSPISAFYVSRFFTRYVWDVIFHGRTMRLMNGNALVARLAKSCFDRNVPIWTSAPLRELLTDDAGGVIGALVDTPTGTVEVRTARGVVLATGGFPQDPARRKQLFLHAPNGHEHASPAPPGNTGDGQRIAEAVGAHFDTSLTNAAAWVPISRPKRKDGTLGTFPHFIDRAKPGIIAVTRSGRRFVNEANSYHDFCQALFKRCSEEQTEVCAFLIADHQTFRRYGLGFAKPSPVPYKHLIKSGYLVRGSSLVDLAKQIGAAPAQLEQTVAEFNRHAARGEDPQFSRGITAYNRVLGDPKVKPNPNVAPLVDAPYYAVKVVIGDLGTFVGLKVDEFSRVQDANGSAIVGLYATGNDALSMMGGNYPGGGITLGPALTFGYVAAKHMASSPPRP